jgi:hypothetical protein
MFKPIPKHVYYPCEYSDDHTLEATDLFWLESSQCWICDGCWEQIETDEPLGISLAEEIKRQKKEGV